MMLRTRRRTIFYLATPVATLLLGVVAVRADVPNLFKDGDPLSAATMNANFKELDIRIEALSSKVSALETAKGELEGKVVALEQAKGLLEAEVEELKKEKPEAPCPAGYTHDASETAFVRCTRGTPVFDEVVKVGSGGAAFWIDRFEASAWSSADGTGSPYGVNAPNFPVPESGQGDQLFYALSKPNVAPSSHVTWFQAQLACAYGGKQLPAHHEWLLAAQGTVDSGEDNGATGKCVTSAPGARPSAGGTQCRSKWGAEDMIGNLWEIARDWYLSVGTLDPQTSTGVKIPALDLKVQTTRIWPAGYNGDATWGLVSGGLTYGVLPSDLNNLPTMGLMGGSYANKTTAGIFAFAVDNAVINRSTLIGFRCMVPPRAR